MTTRLLDRPVLLSALPRVRTSEIGLDTFASSVPVDQIWHSVASADLTGRGGAHFPVARKWLAAQDRPGGIVVANCAEGEPLSGKDLALLNLRPELVIDGLVLAARALRSSAAYVYLTKGHPALEGIRHQIEQRKWHGLLPVEVIVLTVGEHYLAGQSEAVLNVILGGAPLPRFVGSPSPIDGFHGLPAVIHNAETLARIALGLRHQDADEHAHLITVCIGNERVVVDADESCTLESVVAQASVVAGFGCESDFNAVLVGGFGGQWISWEDGMSLQMSNRCWRQRNMSLGAGVLVPVGLQTCGIAETSRILRFLEASSARQCGPCTFGMAELADRFESLIDARPRRSARTADAIQRLLPLIMRRGACANPDGAAALAASALTVFEADIQAHSITGRCLATTHTEKVRSG